ncbi:2217_t:CDS:2 [Paraglomus brasilianum]|uniref:2217_t:CDS:1 n=1 Tax=Paraglomus brasilianum TaxID=144538 RepID=A0A9N8W0Z0_9GLOM|nr:2217_t:CDS:2 [Paraglomus brasilianum]
MSKFASGECQWTNKKERMLIDMASEKKNNWKEIGKAIGAHPKACRDRYVYLLNPTINRTPLGELEKQLILEYQSVHGNKWAYIASLLNNRRTDRQVRNFWYSEKRKRVHKNHERPVRPKRQQESYDPMAIKNLLNPNPNP